MAGEENGKVVVDIDDATKPYIDKAIDIARMSADEGPTGYGAVVTTGDGGIMVTRAPMQSRELTAPVVIVAEFGDGERADRIVAGLLAQQEVQRARRAS